jgi:hypothetical protein
MVLPRLKSPREALFAHLAASAYLLGLLDLEDGRPGVADREEQLWVLVEAGRAVAPIHGGELLVVSVIVRQVSRSTMLFPASVHLCCERIHEVLP